MSTLSIRIPDSYHSMVKKVSKTDNISINQFITVAIGENWLHCKLSIILNKKQKTVQKRNL